LESVDASVSAQANLQALQTWRQSRQLLGDVPRSAFFGASAHTLAGPTGESNVYEVLPRRAVLCVAAKQDDLIAQFAAVLAVGSHAVWDGNSTMATDLHRALPDALRSHITLSSDGLAEDIDAALHHGDQASLRALLAKLAAREGMIVSVTALPEGDHAIPLERLVIERAVSTNTAAAGGNASLMTMA